MKVVRRGKPHHSFLIDTVDLPRFCASQISPKLSHIMTLKLAHFDSSGSIDLLLYAEIFPQILLDGQFKGCNAAPVAINTVFGYVLMAKIVAMESSNSTSLFCHLVAMSNLDTFKYQILSDIFSKVSDSLYPILLLFAPCNF